MKRSLCAMGISVLTAVTVALAGCGARQALSAASSSSRETESRPLLEENYRDATGTGTLLDPKHYESAYEKLARYSTLEEYLYTYSCAPSLEGAGVLQDDLFYSEDGDWKDGMEIDVIRDYYREEIEESLQDENPLVRDLHLWTAECDLNQDGLPDYIIEWHSFGYTASLKMPTSKVTILASGEDGYRQVWFSGGGGYMFAWEDKYAFRDRISVLKTQTEGWYNLRVVCLTHEVDVRRGEGLYLHTFFEPYASFGYLVYDEEKDAYTGWVR